MLLSVVLSFRNEEACLKELIQRLQNAIRPLQIDYELIFVNDASTDRSLEILKEEAKEEKNIKIINTSRPFGNWECMMLGLKYSTGDAVVYMDADLQDPPELIPKMIAKFKEGADVAYTTRLSRMGESKIKMLLTKWGYRLLRATSSTKLPADSGDFKLLSRRVVNEVVRLNEKKPLVKGLITWVGFKQVPVFYHRQKRHAGETHFSMLTTKPLKNFISGWTSFSTFPLTLALVLGFAISFLSFAYLVVVLIMYMIGMNLPGWTALMAVVLILGGTQLLTIGFSGIYLGRIYDEVKGRPNCIVESTIGFEN